MYNAAAPVPRMVARMTACVESTSERESPAVKAAPATNASAIRKPRNCGVMSCPHRAIEVENAPS